MPWLTVSFCKGVDIENCQITPFLTHIDPVVNHADYQIMQDFISVLTVSLAAGNLAVKSVGSVTDRSLVRTPEMTR